MGILYFGKSKRLSRLIELFQIKDEISPTQHGLANN